MFLFLLFEMFCQLSIRSDAPFDTLLTCRLIFQSSICKNMIRTVQNELLSINIVQIPFERFAMFLLFEYKSVRYIANVHIDKIGSVHVKKSFVFIHPYFNCSGSVDSVSVFIIRKGIGMKRSKNVTHA